MYDTCISMYVICVACLCVYTCVCLCLHIYTYVSGVTEWAVAWSQSLVLCAVLHACLSLGAGDLKPGSCTFPASALPLSHVCHPQWARVPWALFKFHSLSEQCKQGDNVSLIWAGDKKIRSVPSVCVTLSGEDSEDVASFL